MKRLVVVSLALLMIGTNQASTIQNGKEIYGKPIPTVTQRPTVTRSAQGRVNIPRIQKPKFFVGNPHKISLFADDYSDDIVEVDDIITAYRREDLQKIHKEEKSNDLSEDVKWRLFLARQLALLKYREIHG